MLIRDPVDLIGKNIHVWDQSSFSSRLRNLSQEIGGKIKELKESTKISEANSTITKLDITYKA